MPVAALLTPRSTGAIAIVQVHAARRDGSDLPALLAALGGAPELPIGAVRLRSIAEIDTALLARPSRDVLQIMPHGGVRIVERLLLHLAALGVELREPDVFDPMELFPEATDRVEAEMLRTLGALGSPASPRAIELLLDQPRRWRTPDAARLPEETPDAAEPARRRRLSRLLHPPRVVIVGAANIGKSTLVNRLAGRAIAVAADRPGTTRDVVVVPLVLDGLALWWHDAPGISFVEEDRRSRAEVPAASAGAPASTEQLHARIECEAALRAARVIAAADLVIAAADVTRDWPTDADCAGRTPDLRVTLRGDLGSRAGADHELSVVANRGIDEFAILVRQRLVPDADLDHPGPWRFFAQASEPPAS